MRVFRRRACRMLMPAGLGALLLLGAPGAARALAVGDIAFLRLPANSHLEHHFCLGPCQCVPFSVGGRLEGGLVLVLEAAEPLAYTRWRVEHVRWTAQTSLGPEVLTGTGILEEFGDFVPQRRLRLALAAGEGREVLFDTGTVFGGLPLRATSPLIACDLYEISLDFFEPRCPADFNADGATDPDDLSDFLAGFFQAPPDPRCDRDLSGAIDPDDLSDFVAAFFEGGCA